MTPIRLKPRKGQTMAPGYPSVEDILQDRRRFLKLLSRGIAAVPLLGIWSCEEGDSEPAPNPDRWCCDGATEAPDIHAYSTIMAADTESNEPAEPHSNSWSCEGTCAGPDTWPSDRNDATMQDQEAILPGKDAQLPDLPDTLPPVD